MFATRNQWKKTCFGTNGQFWEFWFLVLAVQFTFNFKYHRSHTAVFKFLEEHVLGIRPKTKSYAYKNVENIGTVVRCLSAIQDQAMRLRFSHDKWQLLLSSEIFHNLGLGFFPVTQHRRTNGNVQIDERVQNYWVQGIIVPGRKHLNNPFKSTLSYFMLIN